MLMNRAFSARGRLTAIAIVLFWLAGLISCSRSRPPIDTNLKHYQLTGRVVAIDKANKSLTVDGDDIPGFMSAMQMPYDVKDASLLDKLAVGDKIAADVVVKDDDSWLEKIRVTQPSTPAPRPTSSLHIVKLSAA
jgi:protein SCO1